MKKKTPEKYIRPSVSTKQTSWRKDIITKDFWEYKGSFRQFCEENNLPYGYMRNLIKPSKKYEALRKASDTMNGTLAVYTQIQAEQIAKENAIKLLASQGMQIEGNQKIVELQNRLIDELTYLKSRLLKGKITKSEFDEAFDTAISRSKLISATTKNIAEITGKKIEMKSQVDKRILKITADARELAESVFPKSEIEGREGDE